MQANTQAVVKFKFRCEECSQKIRVDKDCSGKWTVCPSCDDEIQIPFVKVAATVNAESYAKSAAYSYQQTASQIIAQVVPDAVSHTSMLDSKIVLKPEDQWEQVGYQSDPQVISESAFDDEQVVNVRTPKPKREVADNTRPVKKKMKMDGAKKKTVINIGSTRSKIKVKAKSKPKLKKFTKGGR